MSCLVPLTAWYLNLEIRTSVEHAYEAVKEWLHT